MTQQATDQAVEFDRNRLVSIVRKWGDVNTDGVLEKTCDIFHTPGIEGVIAYRVEASNAVVFGDPVCAAQDKLALATAFQNHCSSRKLGIVYTIVSEHFAETAEKNFKSVTIEFGKKLILNPLENPLTNKGSRAGLLRKKVKHAQKEGVTVHEYNGEDPSIEKGIESVADIWLQKRHGPQIYLSHVTLFNDRYGKRWFYAKKDGIIIGLLILNELQEKKGWLLNNVMMTRDAPNGLSELMVVTVLETLQKENCNYVLIGPIPSKQLGKISGINNLYAHVTRWAFQGARYLFHLEGHAIFWEKFQPQTENSYIVFPQKNLGLCSVKALFNAFNVTG